MNLKNNEISKNNLISLDNAKYKCELAFSYMDKASKTKENKYLITRASELYFEAIDFYPKLADPYMALAYIFAMYEKYENAILFLEKVLEFEPNNPNAKALLAKYKSQNKTNISKIEDEKEIVKQENSNKRNSFFGNNNFFSSINEIKNSKK